MPEKSMKRGSAILRHCRYWLLSGLAERWYEQRAFHPRGAEHSVEGELLLPLPLIRRAKGPYLYDYDNNRYTDLCLGGGSLILGGAPPRITAAVKGWIGRGHAPGFPTAGHQLLSSTLDRELLRIPEGGNGRPGWKANYLILLCSPCQAGPALHALLRVMGRSPACGVLRGNGAAAPLLDPFPACLRDQEPAGREKDAVAGSETLAGAGTAIACESPAYAVVRLDGTEGPGLEEELHWMRGRGTLIVSDELLFPGYVHLAARPGLRGMVDVRLLGSWTAAGLSFACIAVRWPANGSTDPGNRTGKQSGKLPPGFPPPGNLQAAQALEELAGRWYPTLFAVKGALQALNQLKKSGGVPELEQRHRVLAGLLTDRAALVRDGLPYPARYGPEVRDRLLERGVYGPVHRALPFSVSLAHPRDLLEKTARAINDVF